MTSSRTSSPPPSRRTEGPPSKRVRLSTPPPSAHTPQPVSLHSWLHPADPPPLLTHSPPLHAHTSTFLSISISYTPPSHIRSSESMAKDVRRIVRELDVPSLVGDKLIRDADGAFQDGEGIRRIGGAGGKERVERVREPDHRMWAARGVALGEGRDGTGEDDFQLIECSNDDGEKYGGDRVLRMMKELGGVDAITICCRWYGGDMLGPIRFQHIGTTAHTSLTLLQKLVQLTELRNSLVELDNDIAGLRNTINAMDGNKSSTSIPTIIPSASQDTAGATASASSEADINGGSQNVSGSIGKNGRDANGSAGAPNRSAREAGTAYDKIEDVARLQRLVVAKTKTRETLEAKAAWAGSDVAADGDGAE